MVAVIFGGHININADGLLLVIVPHNAWNNDGTLDIAKMHLLAKK